jgi:hypothetical protein
MVSGGKGPPQDLTESPPAPGGRSHVRREAQRSVHVANSPSQTALVRRPLLGSGTLKGPPQYA